MFCPSCGKQLPDGSLFCNGCGRALSAVESTAPAEETVPAEDAAPANEAAEVNASEQEPKKKKKKSKKGCVIIGCGAVTAVVAVIAAIAVLIVAVFGGISLMSILGGNSNAYAYVSDGSFKLITDLDSDEIITFDDAHSDLPYPSLMFFSEDGKYLYYFSEYDRDTYSGTLCRAQYSKLKDRSTKNDQYIQTIGKSIYSYQPIGDNALTYINTDGEMYYFDGDTSVQIGSDIRSWFVTDDTHIIYTVGEYELDSPLYAVSIKTPEERTCLAEGVYNVIDLMENGDILFIRRSATYDEEAYNYDIDLYVTGFDREEELLGNRVAICSYEDTALYFTTESGEPICMYDYVTDSLKEADEKLAAPKKDDFSTPYYVYGMIAGGTNLKESSYTELYTSCTKKLYWLGNSKYFSYSMEGALKEDDWGDNTAKLHTALQTFITKHGGKANEDGYILVTPEVKKDLQAIQALATDPSKTWQWLWLCYDRYQNGTEVDYDAYYEAQDAYEEAQSRMDMRDDLQKEENYLSAKNLYCYQDGTTTLLAENMLNSRGLVKGLLYNTPDMIVDRPDLSEFDGIYDLYSLFDVDTSAPAPLVSYLDNSVYTMSDDFTGILETWYIDGGAFVGEDAIFFNNLDGDLLRAPLENGVIGAATTIAVDAFATIYVDSTLYYDANRVYDNDTEQVTADLFAYQNGESTMIAKNIRTGSAFRYEDGAVLVYGDGSYYAGHDLTMFDADGNIKAVDTGVTDYIRVDESTLLYLKDGDLYCFDGETSRLIDTDVTLFCSANKMSYTYVG